MQVFLWLPFLKMIKTLTKSNKIFQSVWKKSKTKNPIPSIRTGNKAGNLWANTSWEKKPVNLNFHEIEHLSCVSMFIEAICQQHWACQLKLRSDSTDFVKLVTNSKKVCFPNWQRLLIARVTSYNALDQLSLNPKFFSKYLHWYNHKTW